MRTATLLVLVAACSSSPHKGDEHAHHGAASLDTSLGGWAPEFKTVKLAVKSPEPNGTYKAGEVPPVTFDLQGYTLQEPGPHIHVILDDEPYVAHYDASKPFDLSKLAPGAHVLRTFPSRPWHESIKSSPDAFVAFRFVVGEDDGKFPVKLGEPLFTYSRPKGAYKGEDGKKILFDYYLRNVELSEDGYRVKVQIDDREPVFYSKWEPVWWTDLGPGEHTIAAGLVDASGAVVDNGGLNWTVRKITVE